MDDFITIFEENGFVTITDVVWSSSRYGSWRRYNKLRFTKEYEKGKFISFEITDFENFMYSIIITTRELSLPLRVRTKTNMPTFKDFDDLFSKEMYSVPIEAKSAHQYAFALDANFTFMDVLVAPNAAVNMESDFLTVNQISNNIQNMDVPLALSVIKNEFYNHYCYHDRIYWNPLTGVLLPCY